MTIVQVLRLAISGLLGLQALVSSQLADRTRYVQPPASITVYVFLNTECPVSQQYARRLSTLHRQYASAVRFVAVFPLKTDSRQRIRTFSNEYGLSFDGQSDTRAKLVRQLGARITPEAIVVDRSGRVRYQGAIDDWYVTLGKHRPDATQYYLLDALEALLAGQEVRVPKTEAVGCLIEV